MIENLNRHRVLKFLDMLYSGDIDGALTRCTDDIEYFANAPVDILPHMGDRRGKVAMREMWRAIRARYSETRHEVLTIVGEGDNVAVKMRAYFRKRRNKRIVQFDLAGFYTFRDGRISRIHMVIDSFDLVQQVLEYDVASALTGERVA